MSRSSRLGKGIYALCTYILWLHESTKIISIGVADVELQSVEYPEGMMSLARACCRSNKHLIIESLRKSHQGPTDGCGALRQIGSVAAGGSPVACPW
jgi:hypothetical protein